jgi:hypothetical protein
MYVMLGNYHLRSLPGHVSDIARWRRPYHGVRGRDRGIERGLRQARGQRRLELIGVQQLREPVRHRGRRRTQPGPGADAQPCPASTSLVPARRLRDRRRPAVPGRHARDHHRYQRRQQIALSPRLPRIGQETLQRLPQGHGIRCPSRQAGGGRCSRQATMRTRAWSCRCWSVRAGTRIITTGRALTSSTSAPQDLVSRAAPPAE